MAAMMGDRGSADEMLVSKLRVVCPSGGHHNNPAMANLAKCNVMDMTREYSGSKRDVVTVPHNVTFQTVTKCLKSHSISAVPVLRENLVEGFVDYEHLANFILTAIHDPKNVGAEELDTLNEKLANTPVHKICGRMSHKGDAVHQNTCAADIAIHFSEGIHRVAIFDDSKRVIGVCSQTDVIRHLSMEMDQGDNPELTEFGNQQMLHCQPERNLASLKISGDVTVAEALQKLQQSDTSMLVVEMPVQGGGVHMGKMDEEGQICTFSAKDMQGLWTEQGSLQAQLLAEPLHKFLADHRPHAIRNKMLNSESTLNDTMKHMSEEKVHHALFSKESGCVMVDMTDVFRVLTCDHKQKQKAKGGGIFS
jgi:predicted transcriptional regulator